MNTESKSLKGIVVLSLVGFIMALQFCASPQKPSTPATPESPMEIEKPAAPVMAKLSYADHIQPIMENSCTPCHYPEKGKKKLLNTYEATVETIDDIIYRIQLPTDSLEFMPFKSKKLPLSDVEIKIFKEWRDQGMGR